MVFSCILDLSTQDPQFYALLVGKLNAEQSKGLNEIMVMADQKKAQYASRQIERRGGNYLKFEILIEN